MEIGERIKHLREESRITQAELAKEIGVSPGNVGDWERGRAKPRFDALLALSRFFQISVDWLMTGEDTSYHKEVYPEKIVLQRQDLELLPLSNEEREILMKFRTLTESEQLKLKKLLDGKDTSTPLLKQ
ncbi:helix-turn-helix domain-containing protein [Tepidanaerobacter syntrophicus]|uniref:Helix-turn-helix domain-containing protein n=1 Tax=Tepidanaerobacter syntrophicus TaxID=224999 RepID=A0A0U9HDI7_9FIRM|nr:helix-turn-helix transcriptional regulator [Tepidanaerobacter syntrophicus]GAQ24171.1 helix-turn-helix domain-containing protein [Tepidanaerobacter syntrophicus]GLI20240.1 transcriptional regulator [Tepidanaerobacter syntrophicus]